MLFREWRLSLLSIVIPFWHVKKSLHFGKISYRVRQNKCYHAMLYRSTLYIHSSYLFGRLSYPTFAGKKLHSRINVQNVQALFR
ncbi:uncharacterized protein B0P05DRAFT_538255 [Gilbertella persicaria]|uniref:uncharacterized protein n=1 Tax=Gilbertella persicaria TaxID=101096 RepID=UPI00222025D2|nr:uncharacterized protein B0P05DRAFT_538255 [Gilbertella persicaria]KAI8081835.1 hypothetical protein B0P05DRAFT_538255 [Gilbertella persicaria]